MKTPNLLLSPVYYFYHEISWSHICFYKPTKPRNYAMTHLTGIAQSVIRDTHVQPIVDS